MRRGCGMAKTGSTDGVWRIGSANVREILWFYAFNSSIPARRTVGICCRREYVLTRLRVFSDLRGLGRPRRSKGLNRPLRPSYNQEVPMKYRPFARFVCCDYRFPADRLSERPVGAGCNGQSGARSPRSTVTPLTTSQAARPHPRHGRRTRRQRCRRSPSTSSAVIGSLRKGDRVREYHRTPNWLASDRILRRPVAARRGWCSAGPVAWQLTANRPPLPVPRRARKQLRSPRRRRIPSPTTIRPFPGNGTAPIR